MLPKTDSGEFAALAVAEDDPRVTKFFSSISLKKKKDSEEVSDGHGIPYEPVIESGAANWAAGQQPMTGKEVNMEKARLGMKPDPTIPKQRGRIRLLGLSFSNAFFSSNGSVTGIPAPFQGFRMDPD